jgi:hypothetical protein
MSRYFLLYLLFFLLHIGVSAQPKQYIVTDSMQDASSLYIYRFQQQPDIGGDSVYIIAMPEKSLSRDFYTERLSLFVTDTTESRAYWRRMNALFPIYLINGSVQPREVGAEEGSIILIQEAKNDNGDWVPVEFWHVKDPYINMRYQKTIQPRSFLEIGVPRYQGEYSTTLRVRVLYTKNGRCIYSNQYKGSIRKEQFYPPQPGQRYLYFLNKSLF